MAIDSSTTTVDTPPPPPPPPESENQRKADLGSSREPQGLEPTEEFRQGLEDFTAARAERQDPQPQESPASQGLEPMKEFQQGLDDFSTATSERPGAEPDNQQSADLPSTRTPDTTGPGSRVEASPEPPGEPGGEKRPTDVDTPAADPDEPSASDETVQRDVDGPPAQVADDGGSDLDRDARTSPDEHDEKEDEPAAGDTTGDTGASPSDGADDGWHMDGNSRTVPDEHDHTVDGLDESRSDVDPAGDLGHGGDQVPSGDPVDGPPGPGPGDGGPSGPGGPDDPGPRSDGVDVPGDRADPFYREVFLSRERLAGIEADVDARIEKGELAANDRSETIATERDAAFEANAIHGDFYSFGQYGTTESSMYNALLPKWYGQGAESRLLEVTPAPDTTYFVGHAAKQVEASGFRSDLVGGGIQAFVPRDTDRSGWEARPVARSVGELELLPANMVIGYDENGEIRVTPSSSHSGDAVVKEHTVFDDNPFEGSDLRDAAKPEKDRTGPVWNKFTGNVVERKTPGAPDGPSVDQQTGTPPLPPDR